jgi:RimJ/RimL family protein N-acetyltransferase
VLATPRLILRPWRDEDLPAFAAMGMDREVMEHFPSRLTRDESDAMAGRIRDHFDREGFGLWAVEVRGGEPFIGFTGLMRPRWRPEVVEVGWRLARAHWGSGYATEAARAAIEHGFTALGLAEIVAFVLPANLRSQAVMARLGMTRDENGDFQHPSIPDGHPMRPHWLFRLPAPKRLA